MAQRINCNNSQHSDKDITVENVRALNDGSSLLKEKFDLEMQTLEEISDQNTDDGHPDGGLTAWLIVAGVRFLFLIVTSQSYLSPLPFLRRCVVRARRKYFNQLVPLTLSPPLFLIFHIPWKHKSRAFALIYHASSDFFPYFRTGLAILIHGA